MSNTDLKEQPVVVQRLPLGDFGISWAGENPFQDGFAFGSETGYLIFTDAAGKPIWGLLRPVSPSGESVNGVAYMNKWIAVTTRSETSFLGPVDPTVTEFDSFNIPGGALDVVATPSGHFAIALGRRGIMFLKPTTEDRQGLVISNSPKQSFNVARLLALKGDGGADQIVCAIRRNGVGFAEFRDNVKGYLLRCVEFPGLDFVDICSISTAAHPNAVIAAGRNGTLVVFRDFKTEAEPATLKFSSIEGVVYRLLAVNGDVYLLTSRGLYCLFHLVDSVLRESKVQDVHTDFLFLPIEGADANIVKQKWLVVAGVEDAFTIDIEMVPKSPELSVSEFGFDGIQMSRIKASKPELVDIAPKWKNVEQTLALVA